MFYIIKRQKPKILLKVSNFRFKTLLLKMDKLYYEEITFENRGTSMPITAKL